jgi:hypothetical protein
MKQEFDKATNILRIITENKKLTDKHFSKQSAEKLGVKIWSVLNQYITRNIAIYKNWDKQSYDNRKRFISDVLNLLIENFSAGQTDKPKIYFQEQIKSIWPNNIHMPSALFYSPTLSPWANDMVKKATGSNKPFFAFFHNLSGNGMLTQIVHEFTHYLQSVGKSSISYKVVQQAADYYKFYYADKANNKQIYIDSIHEVEANAVADYIKEQIKQLLISNDMIQIKNSGYTK